MLEGAEILAGEDVAHSHSSQPQMSIEAQSPVANESSPLLGRAIDDGATENSILREWDHVSWWWRPSVCIRLTCRGITSLTVD